MDEVELRDGEREVRRFFCSLLLTRSLSLSLCLSVCVCVILSLLYRPVCLSFFPSTISFSFFLSITTTTTTSTTATATRVLLTDDLLLLLLLVFVLFLEGRRLIGKTLDQNSDY